MRENKVPQEREGKGRREITSKKIARLQMSAWDCGQMGMDDQNGFELTTAQQRFLKIFYCYSGTLTIKT